MKVLLIEAWEHGETWAAVEDVLEAFDVGESREAFVARCVRAMCVAMLHAGKVQFPLAAEASPIGVRWGWEIFLPVDRRHGPIDRRRCSPLTFGHVTPELLRLVEKVNRHFFNGHMGRRPPFMRSCVRAVCGALIEADPLMLQKGFVIIYRSPTQTDARIWELLKGGQP